MADKPILFSGPMIRAILDDRKSMTRRVVKPRASELPFSNAMWLKDWPDETFRDPGFGDGYYLHVPFVNAQVPDEIDGHARVRCPYAPGDHLWVRETTWTLPGSIMYSFVADGGPPEDGTHNEGDYKKRPSIFMPKSICRLWLQVADIRVERLQEITDGDIQAEGGNGKVDGKPDDQFLWFRNLWDSINAKRGYGWDENPWVWVVEFTLT